MAKWGFLVSAAKTRLSGKKAAYSAHVKHLDVLRGKALYEGIAQYLAINPTLAENLVNGLGGYVETQLKSGYKIDFGVFKIGLTVRGGFESANDCFNPGRNEVCVSLVPGVGLKKSVAKLRPENLTHATAVALRSVVGLWDGAKPSLIVCNRTIGANGLFPNTGFSGDGDGVWLETDDGSRVADAKVLSADATRIDFTFEKDVPEGDYLLVVGFHDGNGAALVTDALPVRCMRQRAGALRSCRAD